MEKDKFESFLLYFFSLAVGRREGGRNSGSGREFWVKVIKTKVTTTAIPDEFSIFLTTAKILQTSGTMQKIK